MAVIQMDESYLLGGWFASALWGVSCHALPYLGTYPLLITLQIRYIY